MCTPPLQALCTAALVEGKAKLSGLAKNWVVSYVGNFVGSVALAWLAVQAGLPPFQEGGAAVAAASTKTSLAFWPVRRDPKSEHEVKLKIEATGCATAWPAGICIDAVDVLRRRYLRVRLPAPRCCSNRRCCNKCHDA